MTKKHREKTGKNSDHANASKEVDQVVRLIIAIPGVSTAIPGVTRRASGGKNTIEVRFQRMDVHDTKMKFVVRLRNAVQDLVVIVDDPSDVEAVKQEIEHLFKAD